MSKLNIIQTLLIPTTFTTAKIFEPASSLFSAQNKPYEEWDLEPPVALRWDFSTCGKIGRIGPSQEDCDEAYKETNNGDQTVEVHHGVQKWVVPATGLYLITAVGASGRATGPLGGGRGAILTGNFHLQAGETLLILIGQQSNFEPGVPGSRTTSIGIGGSGGTFVVRESDHKILLIAGGGGSGAGKAFNSRSPIHADATTNSEGRNGSFVAQGKNNAGFGGRIGQGGHAGVGPTGGGGGAGFFSHGERGKIEGATLDFSPLPAMMFKATGRDRGVGGKMLIASPTQPGQYVENNGGFGGGGSGGFRGTAGGGGGFSGGGGGAVDGFSGGGSSLNNGQRPVNMVDHVGPGYVTLTFIGKQCCGPVDVYIAMSFIAGILVKLIITYLAYCSYRSAQRWHTKQVIESHLKKVQQNQTQKIVDPHAVQSNVNFINPDGKLILGPGGRIINTQNLNQQGIVPGGVEMSVDPSQTAYTGSQISESYTGKSGSQTYESRTYKTYEDKTYDDKTYGDEDETIYTTQKDRTEYSETYAENDRKGRRRDDRSATYDSRYERSDRSQTYESRRDRSYDDRERTYDDRERTYDDRERSYDDRERSYDDRRSKTYYSRKSDASTVVENKYAREQSQITQSTVRQRKTQSRDVSRQATEQSYQDSYRSKEQSYRSEKQSYRSEKPSYRSGNKSREQSYQSSYKSKRNDDDDYREIYKKRLKFVENCFDVIFILTFFYYDEYRSKSESRSRRSETEGSKRYEDDYEETTSRRDYESERTGGSRSYYDETGTKQESETSYYEETGTQQKSGPTLTYNDNQGTVTVTGTGQEETGDYSYDDEEEETTYRNFKTILKSLKF